MKSCHILRTAALAAVLALGACTQFQPVKNEPPRLFALQAELEGAPAAQSASLTLAVNAPRAAPGYDSPRMVYVRKTYELESFSKNQWVDTPARMLAPLLVRALEGSGRFRAVVQAPSPVAADLRLDTGIVRLQQEFIGHPSRVHLTLNARLIDVKSARVVASREFDILEDAASEDPYGGVIAANRAVRRALSGLVDFSASNVQR
jgi:cholesterol transport system auxiliary component